MSVEIFNEIFNNSSIKPWMKEYIEQDFIYVLISNIIQNIVSSTKINEYVRILDGIIKQFFSQRSLNIENEEILESIDINIMNKIRLSTNGIEESKDIIKYELRNSDILKKAIHEDFKAFFDFLIELKTRHRLEIIDFDPIFKQSIQSLIHEYSEILNKSFEDFIVKDTELHKNIIKFFKADIISRMVEKLELNNTHSEFEDQEMINRDIVLNLRKMLENDKKEISEGCKIINSNEILSNNIETSTFELIPESIKYFNIRDFSEIFKYKNEEFIKNSIHERIDIRLFKQVFFKFIEEKLKSSNIIVDQNYRSIILDEYYIYSESNNEFKNNIEEYIYKSITEINHISKILERIKDSINNDIVKLLIPNNIDIKINENIIYSYQNMIKEAYDQAFHEIIEQNRIKGVCYCSRCKTTIIYDLGENEKMYEVLCRKCK